MDHGTAGLGCDAHVPQFGRSKYAFAYYCTCGEERLGNAVV